MISWPSFFMIQIYRFYKMWVLLSLCMEPSYFSYIISYTNSMIIVQNEWQWVPKNPTNNDKVHCMGFSCIHWTCYSDKREQFGAETWLITQNLKPEKGCVIEKLSSPSSKENGSIVISKLENCLGTTIMCLVCVSLTMETLWWLLLWYT